MTLKRIFKGLALLSLAVLFAALLWTAWPDGPEAWIGVLILFAWMGGPLALSYLLSSGDREGTGRKALFVFFLAAGGVTAWTFVAIWSSDNSTAAIDLFYMPL